MSGPILTLAETFEGSSGAFPAYVVTSIGAYPSTTNSTGFIVNVSETLPEYPTIPLAVTVASPG